eukprot:14915707-Heterocapsa_arctica.AAC.1
MQIARKKRSHDQTDAPEIIPKAIAASPLAVGPQIRRSKEEKRLRDKARLQQYKAKQLKAKEVKNMTKALQVAKPKIQSRPMPRVSGPCDHPLWDDKEELVKILGPERLDGIFDEWHREVTH